MFFLKPLGKIFFLLFGNYITRFTCDAPATSVIKEDKNPPVQDSAKTFLITFKICTSFSPNHSLFENLQHNQKEEKISCLGVSKKTLAKGEVSQEVVAEMLLKAISKSRADSGAAISGIAGPSGGTAEKPVGTVWVAWGSSQKIQTKCFFIPRKRKEFQILTSHLTLDLLRRECLKLPYLDSYSFESPLKNKRDP